MRNLWGDMEKYVGRKVVGFDDDYNVDAYGRCVRIRFDDGSALVGKPVGDCCAYTQIVEVAGAPSELPHDDLLILKSIEQKNLGEVRSSYDYVDVFGEIVTFTRPEWASEWTVLILCTCTHNGYYSGWIEWDEVLP